ncbi:Uncharacterised protein [Zhongshania aliphaticivorans]|uniref:Outer membrane protein beta-barrel domain-containing protein n=1 Tax=Zhongshania aliphaticivorans TaxID=1470434 RepID=A0A5S9NSX4_9GAMM|nr:hypothetical protein [Zhongshania aliphaticivorans]CAA0093660.1 Uncharacterised protein [Zhongshania aliphaticivorans]CAA0111660.1 Uncharacterised protein [Zhongshania aliphaticivorans]
MRRLFKSPLYPVAQLAIATILSVGGTNSSHAEMSVSTHISTIGPGIELSYKVNSGFGVRAAWQQLSTSFDFQPEDENGVPGDELKYRGDLDLKNGSIFADWYPANNVFRITAGILLNNSGTTLTTNCETNTSDAIATNSCEVGGTSVPSGDIAELRTHIDFEEELAPYIGIGWAFQNNPHWHFNIDLGLAYLGQANVDIQSSGSCNSSSACRAQLDAEEREIEEDMESLEIFPVAKLGFGYRF